VGDARATIAVVVVTYDSAGLIEDLVASLAPGLGGLDWHLTVADNDSTDDTVAEVRKYAPEARVVETGRNAGYAAGVNAAVAAADPYDAVLVLNPDIRLAPGCVPELLAALRRHGAGIAVPRLSRANGEFSPSLRREPTLLRAAADAVIGANRAGHVALLGETVSDRRVYEADTVADWAEGSIMLVDRACWDRTGRWDEGFFLYSEETEYALRARDRGFRLVYTPRAQARHLEGDSATSPPLWTLLTLNRVRLYRRRHGLPATSAYWALVLLREATRAARGNPCSRAATRALLEPRRLRETPGPDTLVRRRGARPAGAGRTSTSG
jgi:N-acetylglucosaminyl-diphospho-decaprenol L-rhamnosyltransferase